MTHSDRVDTTVSAALGGDYRVLDRLAAGETGTLFLAQQVRVGHRNVALKVFHPRHWTDEDVVTRFDREGVCTGRISHPNVVMIYEAKRTASGLPFVAMEYVEGQSLAQHLAKRATLPIEEVTDIVLQCARGLDAAHRLGIVHGDLRPSHIMLTRDLEGQPLVKLLDFESARLRVGERLESQASPYLSYEQACGLPLAALDARSDLYSLALVACEMLLGRLPVRDGIGLDGMTQAPVEPLPPGTNAGDLGPVAEALQKATERDRDRRYQTAVEFVTALREAASAALRVRPSLAAAEPEPVQYIPPWRGGQPAPPSLQARPLPEPTPGPPRDPVPPSYAPPWRRRPVPPSVQSATAPAQR